MDHNNEAAQPRKSRLSAIWVISTLIFCAVFAVTLAPTALAQGRTQDPLPNYINTIRSVFEFIQRYYIEEPDPQLLYEGALSGMIGSLGDPNSAFLPEAEMAGLSHTTQGSFGGVGLYVSKPTAPRPDGRPNYLEVAAPIEGTPGWRAGINPGDLIVLIDGESTEFMSSDEAASRLRGTPGTDVTILIRRGAGIEFPITLTRAVIEVPTVTYAMIGNDIGYLNVLTFTPYTVERSRDAISSFQSAGYQGLIIDLRNNYGGLLDSAVNLTSLFIEGGTVVSIRSRIPTENRVYQARGRAMVGADIPIIVLINRGSASASEIVAGALKDRGRAYLVGEKSFGKGSVQQVYPLDRAGFKITTAHYYTPSDVNIDQIGIPPDREVLFPEFTSSDVENLNTLINSGRIAQYAQDNPQASPQAQEAFAQTLSREFDLDSFLLGRLIRNELNRTSADPVYDLDYDVQLKEAVNILREENFRMLMEGTKTLRALQEEAMQVEDFAQAS
ncbi:MAG: S41 family peptidase [Treponema sp.]|nr:S41 family peptidase [Treponema sp.]